MPKRYKRFIFVLIILLSFSIGVITSLVSINNQKERKTIELKKNLLIQLGLRKRRLENFYQSTTIDLNLIARNKIIREPLFQYNTILKENGNKPIAASVSEGIITEFDHIGQSILEFGYYDFLIVHKDGDVIYSVKKEDDLNSNLQNGKYANTALGVVFKNVMKGNRPSYSAFQEYGPSNSILSSFIAVPIGNPQKNNELMGVLAIQITDEKIVELLGPPSNLTASDFIISTETSKIKVDNYITAPVSAIQLTDSVNISLQDVKNFRLKATVPVEKNMIVSYTYPVALGMLVWFTLQFIGLMIQRYLYIKKISGISFSSVMIVQGMWNSIAENPEKIGKDFYKNLLESDQRFNTIFNNVKNMDTLPTKLVSIMSLIVNNADRMDIIKTEIIKLASFHVKMGIQSRDVPKFMDCIYKTVMQQYDGEFNPKIEKAWYAVLNEVGRIFSSILELEIKNQQKMDEA